MANPNGTPGNLLAPWKPGQSGNPRGRPRGPTITGLLKEVLEATELCGQPVPGGRTVAHALVESWLAHAIKKGDPALIREAIAWVDGKAPEAPAVPHDDLSHLSDAELIARVAGCLGRDGAAGPDPAPGAGGDGDDVGSDAELP